MPTYGPSAALSSAASGPPGGVGRYAPFSEAIATQVPMPVGPASAGRRSFLGFTSSRNGQTCDLPRDLLPLISNSLQPIPPADDGIGLPSRPLQLMAAKRYEIVRQSERGGREREELSRVRLTVLVSLRQAGCPPPGDPHLCALSPRGRRLPFRGAHRPPLRGRITYTKTLRFPPVPRKPEADFPSALPAPGRGGQRLAALVQQLFDLERLEQHRRQSLPVGLHDRMVRVVPEGGDQDHLRQGVGRPGG
ncbi:MAG: hypothetical protein BWX88_04717 [Planctomycetes bacterium ADurb.Bin126]|nr:MAG: hypothetical protein BWX88_04717 [Planctomycetes bacterium ADurb.Bin126]